MEKEKILITGASGTVGSQVLDQLVAKNQYAITVFDVNSAKAEKRFAPYSDKIEIIYGDIRNKADVAKATKGRKKIIHLAAIIPPLADEKPELAQAVNVHGTKNILETMDKDAFFLYSSSISVYGDRIETPYITIEDPLLPSPHDEYAVTKIATEKLIRESNLNWTIFRLAAIMGYGNHKISALMFHMPLNTPMEVCTPEDTARAFVNGIEHQEELLHKTFNLGGGKQNRILYKDFLQRSFDAYGLGSVDVFPDHSFAEKNFHCGYYADGDKLENIVHFRKETLDTYFAKVRAGISPIKRFFASLFKGIVKRVLLKKSEPYEAYKKQDAALMVRFFK
ncbi:nucleoside-diphosphate-sugar epimerase [Balneicella halophila]|uniref:Nucleoside-diphosphate-sugar epimerase n=1 Tax=Balneicella halophila TaxID=1537566 RepID=A0A7L4UQN9_BALHA|nr:NAD(P)-dependent oxidoreductase [Balneicella halophila]PVX52086.1 nucleoside-diphosphate-sugar epimerase [Balneicella halophila]